MQELGEVGLGLGRGIGLGLVHNLFPFSLVGCGACLVLLVDFLILDKLLLELGELGLEGGALENLCFLVDVDDLCGDEVVERLASVLAQEGIGLGYMSLERRMSGQLAPSGRKQEGVAYDFLANVANVSVCYWVSGPSE